MKPRVSPVAGACSHNRQKWESGFLPCATPGCREGVRATRLTIRVSPKPVPTTLGYEPDLEDAVIEELTFRRGADKHGAYEWKVAP